MLGQGLSWEEESPSVAALSGHGRHLQFQLIWPAHGLIELNPIGSSTVLPALTVLAVYSRR